MARSSINFQKTKSNSVEETTRQFEADYLLPAELRQKNEYWDCGKNDAEIFQEQLQIAESKGGRKPKMENSLWEGVLNLNEEHTMQDVKKVAEHIEQKFNIICTRIAVHRDEGKVFGEGKDAQVKYNYHAHLNFVTYKDGRQNWRRQLIKRKDLSELQTEVAKILGMERGQINSTAVRANHRELRQNYDAIMEQRQVPKLKLTVTSLKKEISNLRNELKEKNKELEEKNEQKVYTQSDYVALNALKKELKKDNLQEIYQEFLRLQKQLREKEQQLQKLGSERKEVLNALMPTFKKLHEEGKNPPQEYTKFIKFVDEEYRTYEKELINERERTRTLQTTISIHEQEKSENKRNMDEIEQEIKVELDDNELLTHTGFSFFRTLKEKIISLKAYIQELWKENIDLKSDNEILKRENDELKKENELMRRVDKQLQSSDSENNILLKELREADRKGEYSQAQSHSLSR